MRSKWRARQGFVSWLLWRRRGRRRRSDVDVDGLANAAPRLRNVESALPHRHDEFHIENARAACRKPFALCLRNRIRRLRGALSGGQQGGGAGDSEIRGERFEVRGSRSDRGTKPLSRTFNLKAQT